MALLGACDKMNVLYMDVDGLAIWYKRLESSLSSLVSLGHKELK